MGEWVSKLWYIHTTEVLLSNKKEWTIDTSNNLKNLQRILLL